MLRQLIEAFAFEIRMLKLGRALPKADAAASARDTALLESVQRRRAVDVCVLPDCSTCPSLDVVAEEQRARDLAYTSAWLVERYPDVWYFAKPETVQAVAARLVRLRAAINAGWIGR